MNIFELAELQVIKEGKEVSQGLILDRAIKIRKWLDKHRGVYNKILQGYNVYQYNNRFICIK